MRFFKAIANGFGGYLNTSGTASRGDFWFWILFCTILLCLTLVIDGAYLGPLIGNLNGGDEVMAFDQDAPRWLSVLTLLILVPATLSVAARRLNDAGLSKWWMLLVLTVIGILPLFLLLLKKGKKNPAT